MVKIAGDIVSHLRDHPFALVIVIINVLFIGASTWTLKAIADAGERRDLLIAQMVRDCRDGNKR